MSLSKPINISILPQMSVERNRRGRCGIGGGASDDDVEEEKVGSRDREEEVTCVAHDLQVRELVGELVQPKPLSSIRPEMTGGRRSDPRGSWLTR
ncbi:hypothetical protein ACFX15_015087 [Malus domestica]